MDSLFITKVTAISLFLCLGIASGLDVSLDSPSLATQGNEFEVSISSPEEIESDVKIFVHNSEDESIKRSEYISEIYNEDWKDSWFYIEKSFPSSKKYKIRVLDNHGNFKICARLREPVSKKTSDLICNNIQIKESESNENTNEETNNNQEEETQSDNDSNQENESEADEENNKEQEKKDEKEESSERQIGEINKLSLPLEENSKEEQEESKIYLKSNNSYSTYYTKFYKEERIMFFSLFIFSFILLLLIILSFLR